MNTYENNLAVLNAKIALYKELKQLSGAVITAQESRILYKLEQDWEVQEVLIAEKSNS
jgi:hypothetical protein